MIVLPSGRTNGTDVGPAESTPAMRRAVPPAAGIDHRPPDVPMTITLAVVHARPRMRRPPGTVPIGRLAPPSAGIFLTSVPRENESQWPSGENVTLANEIAAICRPVRSLDRRVKVR